MRPLRLLPPGASVKPDHLLLILVAFVATVVAFTVVDVTGHDVSTLRDVLLALAGALGGAALPKAVS